MHNKSLGRWEWFPSLPADSPQSNLFEVKVWARVCTKWLRFVIPFEPHETSQSMYQGSEICPRSGSPANQEEEWGFKPRSSDSRTFTPKHQTGQQSCALPVTKGPPWGQGSSSSILRHFPPCWDLLASPQSLPCSQQSWPQTKGAAPYWLRGRWGPLRHRSAAPPGRKAEKIASLLLWLIAVPTTGSSLMPSTRDLFIHVEFPFFQQT